MPLHFAVLRMNTTAGLFTGCAGWSLPRASWALFPQDGSHLARYAQRLPLVEINSSFYRPHARKTYARWAQTTPPDFRFSVKLPRSISHLHRLVGCEGLLQAFLDEISGLQDKLGCVLVQLPPTLALDITGAHAFFQMLRRHSDIALALEPRHASWAGPGAEALLQEWRIARVVADPVRIPEGQHPAGWSGLVYMRLHGSPDVYVSPYGHEYLRRLALQMYEYQQQGSTVWCVFDNTARGAATLNACELQELLHGA